MFSTEFELVDFFVNVSKKKNKFYIKELSTNFGRPDIVELSVNIEVFNERKRVQNTVDIPDIQRIDTYILAYLKGKSWVKKKTVAKFLNLEISTLNASIKRLVRRRMLDVESELVKMRSVKELLFITSLTVFEAKLTNWKYVIEQAERHLWFSRQSYILLPELSEDIQRKAEELAIKRGVGLAITNHEEILFKTKKIPNKIINTPLLWEINEGIIDGKFIIE